MKVEHILEELSLKKGLGKLELDSLGKCRILVDNVLVVSIEKFLDNRGFFIYSSVTEVPPEREKEISLMALGGNLFRKETGEASLGYLPKSRALILFSYIEEASIDFAGFEIKLNQFVQYLAYWKNKVEMDAAPELNEISIEKHLFDLKKHQDLKIFFA